jgi:hypothetical protein
MNPLHSKKCRLNSSLNHSEPSSLLSDYTPGNNIILKSPRSEEIQKILDVILNAKSLVIICGMIESTF